MTTDHRFALSLCTNKFRYTVHQKRDLTILNDISISVNSGELLAIVGPSGSGKTSLLNGMADRLNPRADLRGEVLFNGIPERKLIGQFSNYVLQRDYMLEWLTVEETLTYYSKWKLKRESKEVRKERVESAIALLGLEKCRRNYIGGSFKGISGGEMKRVAIGLELLDDPALMFLDEPTSGLDAALAFDVLNLLRRLARSGRTIICTLHQPRSSNFLLFDRLLLLSSGSVAYLGAANEAVSYFSDIGYACPENYNPADFLLDLVSPAQDQHVQIHGDGSVNEGSFNKESETANDDNNMDRRMCLPKEEVDNLPKLFLQSKLARQNEARILQNMSSADPAKFEQQIEAYLQNRKTTCCSWFEGMGLILIQHVTNQIRNPAVIMAALSVNVFMALFLGGIFFGSGRGGPDPVETTKEFNGLVGAMFYMMFNLGFSSFESMATFTKDRLLFNRDTRNASYHESAFYIGKNLADIPFFHIPTILFVAIYYWMVGFNPSGLMFAEFLLLAQVVKFASVSYCYLISTAVPKIEVGNVLAPVTLVIFMLLSGYFIRDDSIPVWIDWLKYVNFLRYAYFGSLGNQFPAGDSFGEDGTPGSIPNELLIQSLGVGNTNVYFNIGIIMALAFGFRIVAYIFLHFFYRRVGVES